MSWSAGYVREGRPLSWVSGGSGNGHPKPSAHAVAGRSNVMEYRSFGKTGLRVSALGFGCGNVGGLIIREEPRTRVRAVARAVEAGINYFDTAAMYGNGQSEQNLGQVLNELKPDVYVGTKVRVSPAEMGDIQGAIHRSV